MTVSDPIADFLTRIRNALSAQHRYVDIPWSKFKESIAEILKNERLIESYAVSKEKEKTYGNLRIYLKYSTGQRPVIQGLKRVSRPGLRRYISYRNIPDFFGGLGIAVLSTSQGIVSSKQAKERKIGGELVCKIW